MCGELNETRPGCSASGQGLVPMYMIRFSRRRTAVWSGACHIASQESPGQVDISSTSPALPSRPEHHRWLPKERHIHSQEPAGWCGNPGRCIDAGLQPGRRANRSSFGTRGQKDPEPHKMPGEPEFSHPSDSGRNG